jgi:hypothetical protein
LKETPSLYISLATAVFLYLEEEEKAKKTSCAS